MEQNSNLPQNGAQETKRGRGRPRKDGAANNINKDAQPKRKRGRPRKDEAASGLNEPKDKPRRKPGRPRKDQSAAAPHEFNGQPKRGPGRPRKHPIAVTDPAVGAGNVSAGTPPTAPNTTPPGQKHINGAVSAPAVSAPAVSANDAGQQTPPATAPVTTLPEREQVNAAIPPVATAVNTGAESHPSAPNTPNPVNEQAKEVAAAVVTGNDGQQTMPVSAPATALPGREPANEAIAATEMVVANNGGLALASFAQSLNTMESVSASAIKCEHGGISSSVLMEKTLVNITGEPGLGIITNPVKSFSWESVTNADVEAAISGSPLGEIVAELRKVTTPPLPLEIALPQALAMIGCAASKDNNEPNMSGQERLTLKINYNWQTQGTNFYCLVAAPSGSGKNVGRYPTKAVRALNIQHYTGCSRPGFLTALLGCPNLLLYISEFKNYLDVASVYENKLLDALTSISNEYCYYESFSKMQRSINFAAPSLLAFIQPDILRLKFNSINVSDGFLGRLLITIIDEVPYFDIGGPQPVDEQKIIKILSEYAKLAGTVEVPHNSFSNFRKELFGTQLWATGGRFSTEHAPKLALALTRSNTITAADCEKVLVLARWFLRHHATVINSIGTGNSESKTFKLGRTTRLLREAIEKCLARGVTPNRTNITRGHNADVWHCDAQGRMHGLKELIDFGEVELKNDGGYYPTGKVAV